MGSLHVQQADGSWSTLDLGAAVADRGARRGPFVSVAAADLGPLGIAAMISAYDEDKPGEQFVAYSPDGLSVSIQPLADLADPPPGYPGSVRVSADAITIVFGDATSRTAPRAPPSSSAPNSPDPHRSRLTSTGP